MGSAARGRKPPAGEPLLERAFRLVAAFGPGDGSLSPTAMSARADVTVALTPAVTAVCRSISCAMQVD
jgi:hypothetical protein